MRFRKLRKSSFVIVDYHEVVNKAGEKELRFKALPRKLAKKLNPQMK